MRVKATLSHFLISLIIFSLIVYILLFFWYPSPYFTAEGGWKGLKIVAAVDLVLGPLLTLIVFDIKKTKVKLIGDLIVIGLLQLSALAWGINTIYNQRPIAIVYWDGEFMTVPAADLVSQNINPTELANYGLQFPVLIYAEKPRDLDGLKKMSKRITIDAVPPHHQIELYRGLQDYYDEIKPLQVDINEIISYSSEMKADLMDILEKTNTVISDYDYFPLRSKYHTIILLFSHDGKLRNHIVVPL